MADFVASLKNGRLWEQTDEMGRRSHRPVLIVEGDFFGYRVLSYEARRGAALYIARYWNVSFIQTRDAKDTVAWLKTLARHVDDKAQEPSVPKPKDLAGQQLRMLQGIQGIGPGRARELLKRFGTPLAVVNASEKDLAAVVGPKTAEKVFSFVRTEPAWKKGAGRGSMAGSG